ncbi:unnamed protein product, partial [Nesidiocoris tenuis]
NDIPNIEAVRGNLKTQFDKNVVTHMEVQEYIFNYTFSHLGIDTNRINHPIVITEAPLNPNFSRSCHFRFAVIVDILSRILLQELLHEHCSIAVDYRAELTKWADPDYYDTHVKLIQLPFTAPPVPLLTPEQQKGRRRETARKLVEVNARKREEKRSLEEFGLKSADELLKTIATLQAKIERIRQKIANSMAGNPDENVETVQVENFSEDSPRTVSWRLAGLQGFRAESRIVQILRHSSRIRRIRRRLSEGTLPAGFLLTMAQRPSFKIAMGFPRNVKIFFLHVRSNVFNPLPAMVGISSDQQSILSSVDAPAEDIEVDIL